MGFVINPSNATSLKVSFRTGSGHRKGSNRRCLKQDEACAPQTGQSGGLPSTCRKPAHTWPKLAKMVNALTPRVEISRGTSTGVEIGQTDMSTVRSPSKNNLKQTSARSSAVESGMAQAPCSNQGNWSKSSQGRVFWIHPSCSQGEL